MKKVHIRAYCGTNLGDDLFVLQLVRRYPMHRFYLYAVPPYDAAFRSEPNLVLPSFASRVLRKLSHLCRLPRQEKFDGQGVDVEVTVGGSVLWENADISFGNSALPRYLIGPNCEPAYSETFFRKLHAALSGVSHCCFRDRHSYALFQDLPNVSCAPDVLFGWKPGCTPCRGEGIGISVISPAGRKQLEAYADAYYQTIAELCDLCEDAGIPVKLLGFCEAEGDGEAIRQICGRLRSPDYPECCVYNGEITAFFEKMNSCETIVATRFHAMILGWVLGKNVVPVIYSGKQTQVLQDVSFAGARWELLSGQQFSGRELLEAVSADSGRLDVTQYRSESEKQFAALDRELNRDTEGENGCVN